MERRLVGLAGLLIVGGWFFLMFAKQVGAASVKAPPPAAYGLADITALAFCFAWIWLSALTKFCMLRFGRRLAKPSAVALVLWAGVLGLMMLAPDTASATPASALDELAFQALIFGLPITDVLNIFIKYPADDD